MSISTLSAIQTVKHTMLTQKKTAVEMFNRENIKYGPVNQKMCQNILSAGSKDKALRKQAALKEMERRRVFDCQPSSSAAAAIRTKAEEEALARRRHAAKQRKRACETLVQAKKKKKRMFFSKTYYFSISLADSDVTVSKRMYDRLNKSRVSLFTQELATLIFGKEKLARCTLTGKSGLQTSKDQLDPHKVTVLIDTVIKEFPKSTVSELNPLAQGSMQKLRRVHKRSQVLASRICGDTFHRVFREFAFCNFKKEDLCLTEPFKCPACTPDMLAISADGNRKHYRFKKSKGYWPYLERMAEKLPELQPLTMMKPFLSVMHAKAHTGKCEVRWGGRNQGGAGNTVGEEVEQGNSFLSRAALTTKYMTKSVVSLRLKRRLFDQVMLVRRLEEEKIIIIKEMPPHYQHLKKVLDKLDRLLGETEEMKIHDSPRELTREGQKGLYCFILHKRHVLQQKLAAVTSTYASVSTDPSFFTLEEDVEEESEDDSNSSELSEEEF
ncbi:hypothetical protein ROHU_007557 [Labeo rohita]|uniref:BEN domain-containing protein n=1 Tax=Labeo rohita TaxID=84645 RepID=A0A498MJF2_LABRO|nr:hypothetical protein ROHU_007557 [Labeo rohita]